MKLRKWSENVVNVENHQFLKGNCNLLLTLYYSCTFYSLFLAFFVLKIFKFKYGKFFIRHSASISNFKAHTWISCSDNETSYLGFIDEYLLNVLLLKDFGIHCPFWWMYMFLLEYLFASVVDILFEVGCLYTHIAWIEYEWWVTPVTVVI